MVNILKLYKSNTVVYSFLHSLTQPCTALHKFAQVSKHTMFVQLAVHDVEPGRVDKLGKASMFRAALRRTSGQNVLKIASHSDQEFVDPGQLGWMHSFVAAASLAYTHHLGLVLRANHIWLCIQQALQLHLSDEAVAAKLRPRIIAEKQQNQQNQQNQNSKIHLNVQTDSCPTVQSAVELLTAKLKQHCQPGFYQTFQPFFSIASPVEQLVSKMTMLAACKAYFTYEVETICGFPSVRLEGSLHDWKLLRRKAEQLVKQYSLLDGWFPILEFVLDKLVLARQGEVDQQFWHNMIHHQVWQGCDRAYHDINGWINAFFPLCSDLTANTQCSIDAKFDKNGMDASDFTTGISSVDIVVDKQQFSLHSGFVGVVSIDDHLMAQPGWYICKDKAWTHHDFDHSDKLHLLCDS